MTELAELVAMDMSNAADLDKDLMCPFCHEEPVGHHNEDGPQETNDKVKSVPRSLKCDKKKRKSGELPFTTAQHHLISALQCYARIRRLVRIGNLVGYDINAPKNGIGLPTTHHTLTYPEDRKQKKYGDLNDKRKVAFALMEDQKAQWHVGHHAFEVDLSKLNKDLWDRGGADESADDDTGHMASYDVKVIGLLLDLLTSFQSVKLCEEEDPGEKFKADMDKISSLIKGKLNMFASGRPGESKPFFVSRMAFDYATDNEPEVPDDDNPPNF